MARKNKAVVLDWQTPTAPPSTRCDVNSVGAEMERWFPGRVVARPDSTPGAAARCTIVRAENGVIAVRVYVYETGDVNAVAELPEDADRSFDSSPVPTVGDLRGWLRVNYTDMVGAGVKVQGHRAGNSKGATRVANTLLRYANPGSTVTMAFRTGPTGTNWERVRATVHKDTIEVSLTDGRLETSHVRPVGAVDRPQEDYFPGTWARSLPQAIALALPNEYAEVQDPRGLRGCLTADIRRQGAGLKPVAYLTMRLDQRLMYSGQWARMEVTEKSDLFPLVKAMIAGRQAGDDLPGLVLLDAIEESVPAWAAYIAEAVAWPAEREKQLKEARERNQTEKDRLRVARAERLLGG